MTPTFVLALSALLHPGSGPTRAEVDFARAVAAVASIDAPMPGRSREETAAVLLVTGWSETRFRMGLRGAIGERCALQVLPRGGDDARALESSLVTCVRRGLEVLRASARGCPSAPLAQYCGSCRKARPRRMSAERLALAAAILSAGAGGRRGAVRAVP